MSAGAWGPAEIGNMVIASTDLVAFGCPRCGYGGGYSPIKTGQWALWSCGECQLCTTILYDGVETMPVNCTNGGRRADRHPRTGTPRRKTVREEREEFERSG